MVASRSTCRKKKYAADTPLRKHLDKSDAELIGRIEREQWRFLFVEGGRKRAGTFFSLGEANEYVGATLEANRAIVNEEPGTLF